jgi:penicillin-binding protein 2
VNCPGGYRLGRRFFRCDAVHGSVDMRTAIEHSCNTYFWSMAQRVGYDAIAPVAKMLGLGQEFDLPVTSQRYGTIPDAAWKKRRFQQEWSVADSLNASIGQGYVSVSPLQLAIMTARMATGRNLQPSLLLNQPRPLGPALPFTPEQLAVPHDGMFRVVNGSGTGAASKININGVLMAGKTGTAQVRAMTSRGHIADWKGRDHSHFICYAPTDSPRYAMHCVVEHGGFGASAAAPIAKDVMTFLFDPGKAWDTLLALEKNWGGTPTERMEAKYASFVQEYGTSAPKVGDEAQVTAVLNRTENNELPTDGVITTADGPQGSEASPAPEATPSPASTASPGASPAPMRSGAAGRPPVAADKAVTH